MSLVCHHDIGHERKRGRHDAEFREVSAAPYWDGADVDDSLQSADGFAPLENPVDRVSEVVQREVVAEIDRAQDPTVSRTAT